MAVPRARRAGRKQREFGLEHRSFAAHELRADPSTRAISGHAAVFGQLSDSVEWGFREQIMLGAFADSLKADDQRALWNHSSMHVIGRRSAGTLTLSEDSTGLAFRATVPETTWADDMLVSIARGDIRECSFGFRCLTDRWELKNGEEIRTLEKVRLIEISAVTFPAYPQTTVAARGMMGGVDSGELIAACDRIQAGAGTPADMDLVRAAVSAMSEMIAPAGEEPPEEMSPAVAAPKDAGPPERCSTQPAAAIAANRITQYRRRLQVVARLV